MGRSKLPMPQRFWSKVKISNNPEGCWEWQACRTFEGYGRFELGGKDMGAHRASWILKNGTIPNGMKILHRCDNPSCVNPDHLFIGTDADNCADKISKGRARYSLGQENPACKLTPDKVIEMRRLRNSGALLTELAEKYGCDFSNVSMICLGKTWKQVPVIL